MSEFKNINGRFCESDYEYALISFLENEGWVYSAGPDIAREYKRDVIIIDDLRDYLNTINAPVYNLSIIQSQAPNFKDASKLLEKGV